MKRLYEPLAYDTETPIGSWWQHSGVETSNQPSLNKDIDADVAIIGAGFTGLNAALQLAEHHGVNAVVLEAAQPGWGASGRNGGFACLGGTGLPTKTQIRRYGLAETKANINLQRAAIDQVATNLEQYNINADTHSNGELLLAHKARSYPHMLEDAEFYRRHFDIEYDAFEKPALAKHGINGPEFHGGIRTKAGFALNPLKYALGLAKATTSAGAKIYGDTPVTNIRKAAAGFILETPKGLVRAKKLIVATNGYSSDDIPGSLAGRFLPLLSTIMVTRPITKDEQDAQGWTSDLMAFDSRHLLHYFRLMPDGRFLFGQRGAVTATPSATLAAQKTNRAHFERMFPAWRHIESDFNWSGLLCLTRNRHQFVGALHALPGAYAAMGYHGNGVAMASLSGRLVADIAMGKAFDLPSVMCLPLPRFPLPGMRRSVIRAAYIQYQILDRFF